MNRDKHGYVLASVSSGFLALAETRKHSHINITKKLLSTH